MRWLVHKLARFISRYPRVALAMVVGYVALSFFEIIPVIEVVTDFIVILSYILLRNYAARHASIEKSQQID